MNRHRTLTALIVLLLGLSAPLAATAGKGKPSSPESFLGHRVGADHRLAPYPRVVEYFRGLAAASPRVSLEKIGTSTRGEEMVLVILTSEENQGRLEHYRALSRRLAHRGGPGDGPDAEEARRLAEEGKVIALVTATIHSTEVGATQMLMEFVHAMATSNRPEVARWLDGVLLLLMPSINPDGQVRIVDWYEEHRGTEYEGGPMPWLYHEYVGHDLNRDFYMLTQRETRAVNRVLYHRWFPQVFLDEHQMGSSGPRMFVPPQTDPLAPEVHSLIFRQADLLGTAMGLRLEEAGKRGVGSNMIYDSYWPGGTRNTAWWKNVTGLLTEVASARLASPLYIEPGELRGGYKGLPEYARRANYPSPWQGGWWRLRDIVDYELIATESFLESCAENRRSILWNFYRMNREAVERGRREAPFAWVVPPGQHDPVAADLLVDLLLEHGVSVRRAERAFTAGRALVPEGSYVVLAAQPYRPFLLTMLRPQRYPEVVPYEDGPVIPPYDVTSWSLPLSMGVEVEELAEPPAEDPGAILAPVDRLPPVSPELAEGPGGYLIPHAADSAPIAVNRLLAEGKRIFWLPEPPAGGRAGDIYLPAGEVGPAELGHLAAELRLPVRALARDEAPTGAAWRVRPPRVGLYRPWVASMDEGWTRFLLERYGFSFVNLHNDRMLAGDYGGDIDVLLLPDVEPEVIVHGDGATGRAPFPPPYGGGLGADGGHHLAEWIRGGGTAVALDSSGPYLIELLGLPARDDLAGLGREELDAPGSMLRVLVDTDHPLGYGLRREEAAYFARSPAYATRVPDARFTRRVVARYPDEHQDIPLSGYLRGAEKLERRAAVVEIGVGAGRVLLIGFRAQHRAQPHRTFKLLFNALYRARLEEVEAIAAP